LFLAVKNLPATELLFAPLYFNSSLFPGILSSPSKAAERRLNSPAPEIVRHSCSIGVTGLPGTFGRFPTLWKQRRNIKRRFTSKQFRRLHPALLHHPAPSGGAVRPASGPGQLLILIPAFNEAGAISDVIREVRQLMLKTPVLVVDDASKDATYDRAKAAGADVLRLPHHLGLGGCVQAGYKLAFELGYEYVIRVDGDGQHDPKYIPDLLKVLRETGCHMVIGSRFYQNNGDHTSFARAIGISIFRLVLRPILGRPVLDPTSGFCGRESRSIADLHRKFSAGVSRNRGAGGVAAQTVPLPGSARQYAAPQGRPQHHHRGKIGLLRYSRSVGRVCKRPEI